MSNLSLRTLLLACLTLMGCGEEGGDETGEAADAGPDMAATDAAADAATDERACDAEPIVQTTADGVDFVRTPDACFEGLPDWPYAPQYVEIDGLRQAYVDVGPADGRVVLLLHGQPSWSYLYRKMIPVLAEAGYRVIAMDHLGMGRSDKPVDIAAYSYVGHSDRLQRFVEALALLDINLFVQDWGSLIGLRTAGLDPERYARIAVGNGSLPVVPAGIELHPPVDSPDEIVDIPSPFAAIPAQQPPFYDGCERRPAGEADFGAWMTYAMKGRDFRASGVVEALTWFDLPSDEEAAYDAPFPSRIYMAGARVFPSLVNELPGANDAAWAGLTAFERPFLTLWAANDPGTLGACETQQRLIDSVPGAAGLPHDRLDAASHFLQDDQGPALARRLARFFASVPFGPGSRYCEVLLVQLTDDGPEAEVWGTPGINDCPAERWETVDAEAIQAETGALAVVLNGPRHWLPAGSSGAPPSEERRLFGELEMRLLAVLEIDGQQEGAPYVEQTVRRTTTYLYEAGGHAFELLAPDGAIYTMQSMSLIVDPEQRLDDLPALGERLELPDGWRYRARALDEDFVLEVEGEAVVLTDDLGNTYQRSRPPSPEGQPAE